MTLDDAYQWFRETPNALDKLLEMKCNYEITQMARIVSALEYENDKLRKRNAKLRELVSLYHYGATHEESPSDVLAWSAKVDSLRRELGIEEEVAE